MTHLQEMANAKDKEETSRHFDDVLKQFHDADDEDDFGNMDFDFQDAHLTQGKDVAVLQHVKDDHEHKEKIQTIVDEQHLSQKLSQLSATEKQDDEPQQKKTMKLKKRQSVEPPINTTKKVKTDKEKSDDEMPKYLSANNGALDKLFNPLLSKTANKMNIEDIRQVALLCHKMALVEQQKLLWSAYLCSGLGTITFDDQQQQQPTTSATLSIWPEEVKSTMMTKGVITTTNETAIDNDVFLNFVHKTLHEYKNHFKQYKTQLHEKLGLLPDFTVEMQDAIAVFIQREGLASNLLQIKIKIAVVEYNYKDRMIDADFHQLGPNQHQLHVFENLTQAKQEKTTTKYDVEILKQRAIHKHLPESITSAQIPPPTSLYTINNQESRQHLLDKYTTIIEQAKSDMMSLYIASAEVRMHESKVKFDAELSRMKKDQSSDKSERKMTNEMINIMGRRFKNMNERLQCLHKLKMSVFN